MTRRSFIIKMSALASGVLLGTIYKLNNGSGGLGRGISANVFHVDELAYNNTHIDTDDFTVEKPVSIPVHGNMTWTELMFRMKEVDADSITKVSVLNLSTATIVSFKNGERIIASKIPGIDLDGDVAQFVVVRRRRVKKNNISV